MKNLIEKLQAFLTQGPSIQELYQTSKQKTAFVIGMVYLTLKRLFHYLLGIVLFGLFLSLGFMGGYTVGIMKDQPIPSVTQLHREMTNSENSARLYYSQENLLATVKPETKLSPVKASELTPLLKKAVIATEDENFYQHHGVLPKSLIRAIFSEFTGIGVQTGGSTLTQQLVKMRFLTSQTTWQRKIKEIFYARKLEHHFSKSAILLSYLNAAPYGKNNTGENITGIETAAHGIFGKSIKELTLPEIAFLAGLPQSPSVYTPYELNGKLKKNLNLGLARKNIVLFRMYRNGDITKKAYNTARHYDLKKDFLAPKKAKSSKQQNSYIYNLVTSKSAELLAAFLIKQDKLNLSKVKKDHTTYQNYLTTATQLLHEKGYHVETTFHKDLYDAMQQVLDQSSLGTTHTTRDYDSGLNKWVTTTEHVENGSVMIDNSTGKILAFTGGVDFDNSQVNHAFDTYRSPGSSIKPYLVYGPAIEHGLISNRTALADFPTKFGNYIPTDYAQTVQNRFISAQEALYMSYNLPAVNLYQDLLNHNINVQTYMSKLGFSLGKGEYKKLGLALGGTSYGFSVANNASAFSNFYNQGTRVSPYFISKITDPSGRVIYQHHTKKAKVFSKGTAYIMQHMLHNVVTKGTASSLKGTLEFNDSSLIGKTGTSNDYRDIWFNGSTPGVTISSWLGYDDYYGHVYNLDSSASETNLDLWAKMANALYERNPSIFKLDQKTKRPESVHLSQVLDETGTRPGLVRFGSDAINLTGTTTTALSLTSTPPASARFGIGASQKDYKSFYDYVQGKKSTYSQPLTYTGKTISKKADLDKSFVLANGQSAYQEYYGNGAVTNTTPSENSPDRNVQSNSQEPQSGNGGNGNGNNGSETSGQQNQDDNNTQNQTNQNDNGQQSSSSQSSTDQNGQGE